MKLLNEALRNSHTILFIDFEGTQTSQEIIAIGAVKCDLDNKNQIKKTYNPFKVYVKSKSKVGHIVTKLTGINDKLLETNGLEFSAALEKLKKYLGNYPTNMKFISYGNFDLRLLHQTATINDLNNDPLVTCFYRNHIDFSNILQHYVRSIKNEQLSLLDALKVFRTTPYDGSHDPAIDAKNLMLLYRETNKSRNILEEEYKNVLINNPHTPLPILKVIKKIDKDGSCSSIDFEKFIREDV